MENKAHHVKHFAIQIATGKHKFVDVPKHLFMDVVEYMENTYDGTFTVVKLGGVFCCHRDSPKIMKRLKSKKQ